MEGQEQNWKNVLLTLIGVICILGVGFYLGVRVQEIRFQDRIIMLETEVIESGNVQNASSSVDVVTLEVPEVFWPGPGGDTVCPDTHPYKGKFDSNGNPLYAPENSSYSRVRAHVCFATSEFAVQQAGFFVKK